MQQRIWRNWMMLSLAIVLAFLVLGPVSVRAQDAEQENATEVLAEDDSDKGFITRFLQEQLSGSGRVVTIDGFEGALSSRATFTRLTISDKDGAWITLENGAIQWTRSALLARRVQIQELSAERLILPRLPVSEPAPLKVESPPFALPELPVSLNIEKLSIDRVELGEPVIGIAAAASVQGSMSLAGGEGEAKLAINRLDGPRGLFSLDGAFSNATRHLRVALDLDEDADGLFVNLVGMDGLPSVKAEIKGEGPLGEFAADLRLATSGQDRITGSMKLDPGQEEGAPGTNFRIEMGGDIATIVPPEHKAFFGRNSQLLAEGWRGQTGQLRIPVLMVHTDALNLSGAVTTTEKGAPESAVLLLNLGEDASAPTVPVRLPWADKPTTVRSGTLQLSYDSASDAGWTLKGRVGEVARAEGKLEELRIDGRGRVNLKEDGEALESIRGWVAFGMDGIAPTDPALAHAVGEVLNGGLNFDFTPGNALELFGMNVNGTEYGLKGDMLVDGLSSGIVISGDTTISHDDLGRFSGLASRQMSGAADAQFVGYYVLLNRAFDINAEVRGNDIAIGQENADRLLAGRSLIRLDARRLEDGIELDDLTVRARNLTVAASGLVNLASSNVRARISMPDLSVAAPDMAGRVQATAHMTGPTGRRQLDLQGQASDLVTGIAELDGALQGQTNLRAIVAQQPSGGFELTQLQLANPQLKINGQGRFAQGDLDAKLDLDMPQLAVLDRGISGGVKLVAEATEAKGVRHFKLTGTGSELRFGPEETGDALSGVTHLSLLAQEQNGNLTIETFDLKNDQMDATASGRIGAAGTDLQAKADIRSLAAFGRGWRGAMQADASFKDDGQGGRALDVSGLAQNLSFGQAQVDGALAGETRLTLRGTERDGVFSIATAEVNNPRLGLDAAGRIGAGVTDLDLGLNASDLRFLGRGFRGAMNATGKIIAEGNQHNIQVQGYAENLAVGQAMVDPVLAGRTSFDGSIAVDNENQLTIRQVNASNGQLRVTAGGDPSQLTLDARLANLALVVPGFEGPLELRGTVGQSTSDFQMDVNLSAPSGLQTSISGTVARNFSNANLGIRGTGDAAIVNPILRTRSVAGPASFDLRLNGRPSVEALNGRLSLSQVRLAEPKLGLSIADLNATADFNGGRIQLQADGRVEAGGTIHLSGPITLTGSRQVDLELALRNVILRDPNLYEILLGGGLKVGGSLGQGLAVSGQIDVAEAELRIPSTGFGGAASIPPIKHLYDRPPVRATRAKAGLSQFPSSDSQLAGMNSPAATPSANPARFDLTISAPRQVFVRGRGVDAELGGRIHVGGNARQPIPVGQLELIRGRVDLLGKRFDLSEGLIELQGSLIPVIRLVATTSQDSITTRIIIDGEAQDPEIKFESTPQMPEEEVLSHLLFGRGLDTISPLQAAQLANAIAVLAGKGGEGIVGRLRSATGLDDLDLSTDDEGNVSVRAGKYLSKNLYTDVEVGADGLTRLNLNLDISRSLTARGAVDSEGDSTLGVYYERDY